MTLLFKKKYTKANGLFVLKRGCNNYENKHFESD